MCIFELLVSMFYWTTSFYVLLNCSYLCFLNCSYYWITYIYVLLNCSSRVYVLLNNSDLRSYAMLTTEQNWTYIRSMFSCFYLHRGQFPAQPMFIGCLFSRETNVELLPLLRRSTMLTSEAVSGNWNWAYISTYYAVWSIGITTVTYVLTYI